MRFHPHDFAGQQQVPLQQQQQQPQVSLGAPANFGGGPPGALPLSAPPQQQAPPPQQPLMTFGQGPPIKVLQKPSLLATLARMGLTIVCGHVCTSRTADACSVSLDSELLLHSTPSAELLYPYITDVHPYTSCGRKVVCSCSAWHRFEMLLHTPL